MSRRRSEPPALCPRILKVLGLGTFGKVFLVRLKSHRLISEDLYPHFFPQYSKFVGPEPGRLPDGLAEESPACSKYWLPPNKLYPETDAFQVMEGLSRETTASPEQLLPSFLQNYYAMKVVPKHLILRHSNDVCHLQTELRTLKKMDHPFLVRLISSFQTKQKVFFITDYYPGRVARGAGTRSISQDTSFSTCGIIYPSPFTVLEFEKIPLSNFYYNTSDQFDKSREVQTRTQTEDNF